MTNSKTSNTNPKNANQKIPASIIFTGKILQFIAPRLAASFAIKLFQTPIRFQTPEREKMMAKSAKKELIFITELNKSVMVYSYGYSKRKVLLVHGWSGRGTQLYKIADRLLEQGFMTVSFDGPAHGESSGKITMMKEFIKSTKVIEDKYGPFEVAIGHSLGGMSVLNSVKQGLSIKKSIIIGAGDIITDIIYDFVHKLALNTKMVQRIKKKFHTKFNEDIDIYSTSVAAKKTLIPTLVIHDTEDYDVPVSCAHNIRQNLQNGELFITNGLGHRRILKDNQVINRIINFINRTY